jgi:hypothetical protein
MPNKKNVNIKYTSRDFESIKQDLIDHAKRYYPDNYRDFTTPSFGSMVFDAVAYVGDVLSYYVDYSVNESFLDTSIEFDNIRKHARSLGYNFYGTPSSYGVVSLFVLCPSNADGTAPDTTYLPIIKKGTSFSGIAGGNYVLTEDVNFNAAKNEFVAARFNDTTGATTHFAVKVHGQVQSGIFEITEINLNNTAFEKFKKVKVGDSNITEVFSVVDSSGNKYYEVDNLAQEVVFVETTNKDAFASGVRSILKPFVATRRFTLEQDDTGTYLQFGFGSEDEDAVGITDPSKIAIKMHGKKQITNNSFDPTKLLSTNKFGISPYNTILKVIYRTNDPNSINAPALSIKDVVFVDYLFNNLDTLNTTKVEAVKRSLEVSNEQPITGFNSDLTNEELKVRAKSHYATQNRAVTKQDYESIVYQMPPKFGSIKRANIINDPSSSNRKISIYVVSEDDDKKLAKCDEITKNNIKNWISRYIPINDSVELKDAFIVNFSIDFNLVYDRTYDPNTVLFACQSKIEEYLKTSLYIGEPLYLSTFYNILNKLTGVTDVKKITIKNKSGGVYSSNSLNFDKILSKDGTYLKVPKNVILELKYPAIDIKGTVR